MELPDITRSGYSSTRVLITCSIATPVQGIEAYRSQLCFGNLAIRRTLTQSNCLSQLVSYTHIAEDCPTEAMEKQTASENHCQTTVSGWCQAATTCAHWYRTLLKLQSHGTRTLYLSRKSQGMPVFPALRRFRSRMQVTTGRISTHLAKLSLTATIGSQLVIKSCSGGL